jgi:hypothetical protein
VEGNESEPTEVAVQRIMARYELFKRFVPAVWILAAWVPLQAVYPIAQVLAGKQTNVTVTVSISVVITLTLAGAYGALVRKARTQGQELVRLRERCNTLEVDLDEARARLGGP